MKSIRFSILACILSIIIHDTSCNLFGDVIQHGFRTTLGIVKHIPHQIPSPNNMFEMTKNALIGLPLELTFDVIHEFCKYICDCAHIFRFHLQLRIQWNSCLVSLGAMALSAKAITVKEKYTPQISNLTFILRTRRANVSIPITNPTQLWEHHEFNPSLPLVIFVTGWRTNLMLQPSEAQDTLANAYLCRGNVNFVVSFPIYTKHSYWILESLKTEHI